VELTARIDLNKKAQPPDSYLDWLRFWLDLMINLFIL